MFSLQPPRDERCDRRQLSERRIRDGNSTFQKCVGVFTRPGSSRDRRPRLRRGGFTSVSGRAGRLPRRHGRTVRRCEANNRLPERQHARNLTRAALEIPAQSAPTERASIFLLCGLPLPVLQTQFLSLRHAACEFNSECIIGTPKHVAFVCATTCNAQNELIRKGARPHARNLCASIRKIAQNAGTG